MANVGSLLVEIGADVARLRQDMGKVKNEIGASMKSVNRTMKTVGASMAAAFSVGAAVNFGKEILETGKKVENLHKALKQIEGGNAAATFQFLRKETERLGLEFFSTADAFKNIDAAAKGTALQGQPVRDVFVAVSEAATVLGLSADQTGGALNALSQMISKGKVQAEELRGQLGERLPGAFQLAARAMGVTTAELDKMLADGKILASDLLPKLATVLHEEYSEAAMEAANSTVAAANRMTNAWEQFKASLYNSDAAVFGINSITNALKGMTGTIDYIMGERGDSVRIMSFQEEIDIYQKAIDKLKADDGWFSSSKIEDLTEKIKELREQQLLYGKDMWLIRDQGMAEASTRVPFVPPKVETTTKKYSSQFDAQIKDWQRFQDEKTRTIEQFDKDYKRITLGETAFQIAEVKARSEQLQTLVAGDAEKIKQIKEWEAGAIVEINEQAAEKTKTAWERYADAALDNMTQMDGMAYTVGRNLEDSFVGAFTGAEMSAMDFFNTIYAEMVRISVAKPLAGALTGGIGDILGSLFHSGGVVGSGGSSRSVSAAAFLGAPRYHSGGIAGLAPDEVPAILQRGEIVIPKGSTSTSSSAPNLSLTIINETGQELQTTESDISFDGEKWVMTTWLRGIRNNTANARDMLQRGL